MESMDRDVKIFFTLWLLTIIIFTIYMFTHQTIVVNNYISDGNYTFDVGTNMMKIYNESVQ